MKLMDHEFRGGSRQLPSSISEMGVTQGKWIGIEGLDGCGKGNAIKAVRDTLQRLMIPAINVREPGSTVVSEKCREILLDPNHQISDLTEVLLMSAARRQLFDEKILPALQKGTYVIGDRSLLSMAVYQGWGRRVDMESIENANALALGKRSPDITLWLDVSVETSIHRVRQRQAIQGEKAPLDSFEKEAGDFFQRVRAGYQSAHALNPSRIKRIDADQPVGDVEQAVAMAILEFAGLNRRAC